MSTKDEIETLKNEESQMTGEGWKRELTIKKIVVRDGVIYCQEWDFFADTMPCRQKEGGTGPECGSNHTWLRCLNGKLFWACALHKTACGPITFDVGRKVEEYPIDVNKAVEVCKEYGQPIPTSVRDIYRATQTIRSRRPRP